MEIDEMQLPKLIDWIYKLFLYRDHFSVHNHYPRPVLVFPLLSSKLLTVRLALLPVSQVLPSLSRHLVSSVHVYSPATGNGTRN